MTTSSGRVSTVGARSNAGFAFSRYLTCDVLGKRTDDNRRGAPCQSCVTPCLRMIDKS
ncbi:hypothetical protein SAMN05444172_2456 [Burkholderia sp. GAS332]|nr:hypothetical protein SAMN05444172_2456 [Burkholderia sp. GAS332]